MQYKLDSRIIFTDVITRQVNINKKKYNFRQLNEF